MHTVGIDVGSTNVKAALVGSRGEALAAVSRSLHTVRQDRRAELDAAELWATVVAALGDLARAADGAGCGGLGDVGAVGVCGQYSSIVAVDAELEPVAPLRLYLDTRGTARCREVLAREPEALATWTERHPIPPVGGGLSLGHLLAFQLDEPEVHRRTRAYLEPVDFVTARLTGVVSATQASMFASQLVDNRQLGRTAYDPDLVRLAGVDPTRLPPLVAPGAAVGAVRADVAAATGLPPDAVVVAGITDSHAFALATGAAVPGRVGVAIGTTAVLLATTPHFGGTTEGDVLAMPGVEPGEYLVWAENGLAGRVVEQILTAFVHGTDALGDHAADDVFQGFDAALLASPPGAAGVRFLPWFAGSMAPVADPAMRGGFLGVSLDTRRVDLVRAVAEGVAHNIRWLLGPVSARAGVAATELVLAGGAARSPAWAQIVADVVGLPVHVLADPAHAGSRAVAVWAGEQVGGDGGSRVDGPGLGSGWGHRHDPDPDASAVHHLAHEQFTAAFHALRPLRLGRRPS